MLKLKVVGCFLVLLAGMQHLQGQTSVFAAINTPTGMTYDQDRNVWVASFGGNEVVKLQGDGNGGLVVGGSFAVDGVIERSANVLGVFPVGIEPTAVTCDCGIFGSAGIWISNYGSNTVTKLDKSGAYLGSFTVGAGPRGLTVDISGVWVANSLGNTVTLLDRNTGATIGIYGVGAAPFGVASDGVDVWVANRNSNTVMKLAGARSASGQPTGTILYIIPVASQPQNLVSDGSNMWVSSYNANTVTKIQISTGAVLDGAIITPPSPGAIIWDGNHVWTANYAGSTLTAIDKNVDRGPSFTDPLLLPNPYGLLSGPFFVVISSYTNNMVGAVANPFFVPPSAPPPPPPPPPDPGGPDPNTPQTPQTSN